MSEKDIAGKAAELKELKRMQEELAAEIAAIEETIKAEMTAREVEELTAGIFTIRWKPVTSMRLDQKTFKAELPDVYGRYCIENTARRFTVA